MRVIFFLFFFISTCTSYSQKYEWDFTFGNVNSDYITDISIDSLGFIYVIGTSEGILDMDPSSSVFNISSNDGGHYTFMAKYTDSKELVWAYDFDGLLTNDNSGNVIEVISTDGIVITGGFVDSIDIDPSSGSTILTSTSGTGSDYIAKFDFDGNLIWGKVINCINWYNSYVDISDVTNDIDGNIYITGRYYGLVDSDPGINTHYFTQTITYDYDIFVIKLNSDGNYVWSGEFDGGSPWDVSNTIECVNLSDIYIGGHFSGNVDFNSSSSNDIYNAQYVYDAFITKIDTANNYHWTKVIGGSGNHSISDLSFDSYGQIYVIGTFQNTVDFNPSSGSDLMSALGYSDLFISKYDMNGDYSWTKSFGGIGGNILPTALKVSEDSSIYFSGVYYGPIDFDPGSGVLDYPINDDYELFMEKIDNDGNFKWNRRWGVGPPIQSINSMVVKSDTVYAAGNFQTLTDFNWGSGESNHIPNGMRDNYILKITGCEFPVYGSMITTVCDSLVSLSGNQVFYTSGNYTDTTLTYYGCDSIIDLDLVIINSTSVYDSVVFSCESVIWNDEIINVTGVYDDSLQNISGCDSIIRLHFEYGSNEIDTTAISCNYFNWRDNLYLESGVYTDTLSSVNGCDSITILDLTILNSVYSVDYHTSCEFFTWIDGVTYTASNNIASDTVYGGSVYGCDSIVTLDLTILNSINNTDFQIACDSLVWIDDVTYYSDNNSAVYFYPGGGANGCDSIITLDLIINTVDITTSITDATTIVSNDFGSFYNWLNCNDDFSTIISGTNNTFIALENGEYAVEITQDNCVDTSECILINSVGIQVNENVEEIIINPNPSDGIFSINLNERENVSIEVFSLVGKLVYREEYINSTIYQLILNEAKGVYIVEINYNDSKEQYKLIVN